VEVGFCVFDRARGLDAAPVLEVRDEFFLACACEARPVEVEIDEVGGQPVVAEVVEEGCVARFVAEGDGLEAIELRV
jgi:hypothetical protein